MSDIFLSYARRDQARAKGLVKALEGQGWTVFWDRTIPAGDIWHETIPKQLEYAGCVVVAWSKHSIKSNYVIEEANKGCKRKILLPVFFDDVEPPLGFGSIQSANLANWDGNTSAEEFLHLVKSIKPFIGLPKTLSKPTHQPIGKLRPYLWLALAALVVFVGFMIVGLFKKVNGLYLINPNPC